MAEGGYWRDETDHERFPCHSGLYTHLSQARWEKSSIEACTVLNMLGYGSHIRQARRDYFWEWDRNSSSQNMTLITTGSKAEGLTRHFESDIDLMIVYNSVICLENDVNNDKLPKEMTVLTLNTGICYPGHCILFLEERSRLMLPRLFRKSICPYENGRAYLSSDQFINYQIEKVSNSLERRERVGPSMPTSLGEGMDMDIVPSLRCSCPSILRRWADRHRHWPPSDIVQKIVSMEAFVAPVGFDGSAWKHAEWTICFNTGENELVRSLNNTQVYIYVLLRMVVKDVLKPVKKEVTSFTVKNIVLWLAENNPPTLFNERTLFHWLREGLVVLRSAILTEHLPYYMIPERNLMAARGLDECQQRIWIQMITDMVDEGPMVLLRLPKMRQAIISHPEHFMWYSKKRVELELIDLKLKIRMDHCKDVNGVVNESDTTVQAILRRSKIEILIEVHQRMRREGSRVDNLNDILKYMLM